MKLIQVIGEIVTLISQGNWDKLYKSQPARIINKQFIWWETGRRELALPQFFFKVLIRTS